METSRKAARESSSYCEEVRSKSLDLDVKCSKVLTYLALKDGLVRIRRIHIIVRRGSIDCRCDARLDWWLERVAKWIRKDVSRLEVDNAAI